MQQRKKLSGAPTLNEALASEYTSCHHVSNDAPDTIGCNSAAVEIIGKDRLPFYIVPRLKKGHGKQTAGGSKKAKEEFERRNVERGLYRQLSQYYELPDGEVWKRPPLLVKGKHGHDHLLYW